MNKLSRNELIELVEKMLNVPDGVTDEDVAEWMRQVEYSVPDPNVSGLIYSEYSGESAEQIVDKALAYRPIAL